MLYSFWWHPFQELKLTACFHQKGNLGHIFSGHKTSNSQTYIFHAISKSFIKTLGKPLRSYFYYFYTLVIRNSSVKLEWFSLPIHYFDKSLIKSFVSTTSIHHIFALFIQLEKFLTSNDLSFMAFMTSV